MEVRGRQPNDPHPAQRRFHEERVDLFQRNRAKVRRAREILVDLSEHKRLDRIERQESAERMRSDEVRSRERADRVELSEAARGLAQVDEPEREARLAELEQAHQAGELNTPERVEQAAQRILGG